eukprot:scaffold292094_cov43-Tisochrysis_lutea.AAC.2
MECVSKRSGRTQVCRGQLLFDTVGRESLQYFLRHKEDWMGATTPIPRVTLNSKWPATHAFDANDRKLHHPLIPL